jgi:hypothetical protein
LPSSSSPAIEVYLRFHWLLFALKFKFKMAEHRVLNGINEKCVDTEDTIMTDFGEILCKNLPPRFNTTEWLSVRQDFGGGRGVRVHGGAGRRCRATPEAMASTIAWYVR